MAIHPPLRRNFLFSPPTPLHFASEYGTIIKPLPRRPTQNSTRSGRLAQLVEHLLDVQEVTGSSPVPSTKTKPEAAGPGFCFARASQRRTRFESCTAAQARRCLRQKQPSWSRGSGLNFQAHCMRAGNSGHRNPNHQTRRIRTQFSTRKGSGTFFLCLKCCTAGKGQSQLHKTIKGRASHKWGSALFAVHLFSENAVVRRIQCAPLLRLWPIFYLPQGQPQLAAEGRPNVEAGLPAVGRGDLGHQPQPGAVGGPAVRLQRVVGPCRGGSVRRGSTLHPEDQPALPGPGPQPDGTAGGVMAHTVGEQVVHRPPQQEGVRLDGGQGRSRKGSPRPCRR